MNDLRQILGDAGYREFTEYNRMTAARDLAGSFSARVYEAAGAMTDAQAGQLTKALANASAKYQGGGSSARNDINWDAAIAQAQGFLSTQQIAALRAFKEHLEVTEQIGRLSAARLAAPVTQLGAGLGTAPAPKP